MATAKSILVYKLFIVDFSFDKDKEIHKMDVEEEKCEGEF